MFPINYESWHHMPDSNKNQALANIKERFALEVSDDHIKKALGKKWRDNKSTLKKLYFKKDISLEEKLRNVPPGMLRYQWEDAVRFWNSKKGEVLPIRTSSRQTQKFKHTVGSRSFASVAEADEVSSGEKVGRLQLFEITHRKKDGSFMTSEAEEIIEKLKRRRRSMKRLLRLIVLLILRTLITELSLKFWVLKDMVGFDFKDLVLPRPNILDPTPSSTCLPGVKLKLKFTG
ncbi:hypothetical protein PVK06_004527 [Gossypium arboreum]|uniref:Uncharacterized protein n=1 Tax=Gossypium arboreum TaxID=29729 RepID=A0ABR0QTK8_GOSAR|nr:hypothetical protein PVK06_004527 [Gossypium arboreum]